MSHANAALTPRARLRLAEFVVEGGWTYAAAAKMFMVAPRTAKKWADRFRTEGAAGMVDRSSRPYRSPTKTSPQVMRRIVDVRWRHRLGPVQIAGQLGMPASTVHAVLTRCRINRLSYIDRVTGEPLRRYEHDHPGSLIHVDVTKFANIPDGGGHKFVSRQLGDRNAIRTAQRTGERSDRSHNYRPRIGIAFVHTVIDDHSRMAYAEICTDERAASAVAVLQRAVTTDSFRTRYSSDFSSDFSTGFSSGSLPYFSRAACTNLRASSSVHSVPASLNCCWTARIASSSLPRRGTSTPSGNSDSCSSARLCRSSSTSGSTSSSAIHPP